DHALGPVEARDDRDPFVGHDARAHVAPYHAILAIGDQHIAALLVGLDRALGQARRDDRAAGDRSRGEAAGTDRRIVPQLDAGDSLTIVRIEDRRNPPDPADE